MRSACGACWAVGLATRESRLPQQAACLSTQCICLPACLHTCLPPGRAIVVVDRPLEQLGQAELSWLQQVQLEMLPRLRVRANGTNRVSLMHLTAGCWGSRYGQPPDVRTQPVDCTTRRDVARNANQPLPSPPGCVDP